MSGESSCGVAPRVGAWIETVYLAGYMMQYFTSHPVWVRGLKRESRRTHTKITTVAPRVGAWIETHDDEIVQPGYHRSHPVWVRGLKHSDRR